MLALLIEANTFTRDLLADYLIRSMIDLAVVTATSISDAVSQAESLERIDVIVANLGALSSRGYDDIDAVKGAYNHVPVVLLAQNGDVGQILEAYARGADGVVPHVLPGCVLSLALQLVLCGEKFVPSTILSALGLSAGGEKINGAALSRDNALRLLTRREREVLSFLFEGNTNAEIGSKLDITANTVRLHLSGIYRKLKARNRLDAVRIATTLGFASALQ